jgi:hypothetical protein
MRASEKPCGLRNSILAAGVEQMEKHAATRQAKEVAQTFFVGAFDDGFGNGWHRLCGSIVLDTLVIIEAWTESLF